MLGCGVELDVQGLCTVIGVMWVGLRQVIISNHFYTF